MHSCDDQLNQQSKLVVAIISRNGKIHRRTYFSNSMDTRTASRPFYETVLRFARFTFREMNRGGRERERERKGERLVNGNCETLNEFLFFFFFVCAYMCINVTVL